MKKLLPDLIAILAFVLLSFAYFFPADIENRILFQHDTAAGAGAGQGVLRTDGRTQPLDKLAVRRYAHVSDSPFV